MGAGFFGPEEASVSDKKPRPFTASQERMATPFIRAMSVANTFVYKLSGGRVGGRFTHGAPVCLVTTTGRKTGKPRVAPLIYLADGDDVVLVASKGGMSHSPAWYHNLAANPEAEVQIRSDVRKMRARRASDEEKAKLWPKLLEVYPDYDDYQARTERNIPVMILSPR